MLLLYSQVFPISNFFTAQCLDVRFWDFLHFICLKLNLQYWYLLLGRKRMCWFVFVFNKGREEAFAGSLQNRKSCLSLFRPRKLISVWVLRFYTRCKMHITPVLLKNYSFHNFLNRSNFAFICCFSKKKFSPQKMFMSYLRLRHCAYLNSASNVLAYLLIIILRRDWFGFFLNKWGCIRSTP